jgi:hypothetical protein
MSWLIYLNHLILYYFFGKNNQSDIKRFKISLIEKLCRRIFNYNRKVALVLILWPLLILRNYSGISDLTFPLRGYRF